MAEDVILVGIGAGIPAWASEVTQKKVLDTLEKSLDIQEDMLKAIEKVLKQLGKLNTGGKSKSNTGGKQGAKDAEAELREIIKKLTAQSDSISENTEETDKNTKSKKKLSNVLSNLLKVSWDLVKSGFGLLMTGLGKLAGMVVNQMNVYHELNKAGLDLSTGLSGGLASLADLSEASGLAFDDLLKVMSKFSQAVTRYGTKQFASTVGMLKNEFSVLGYDVQELSEFLGGYLESQRMVFFQNTLNQNQLAAAAKESAENTVAWSHALGKSREEIEKQRQEALSKADVMTALEAITDPEVRARAMKGYENLAKSMPESMLSVLDSMLQGVTPEASKMYGEIMKAGGTEMAFGFSELAKAVKSGNVDSIQDAMSQLAKLGDIGEMISPKFLQAIATASPELYDMFSKMRAEAIIVKKDMAKRQGMSQKELALIDANNAKMEKHRNDFYNILTQLRATIEQIVGEAFGTNEAIGAFTKLIGEFVKFLVDNKEELVFALKGLISTVLLIGTTLGNLFGYFESFEKSWEKLAETFSTDPLEAFAIGGVLVVGILAMFKVLTLSIKAMFASALRDLGGDRGDESGARGRRDPRRRRGGADRGGLGGMFDKAKDLFKPGSMGNLLKIGGKFLAPIGIILSVYDSIKGAFESGAKAIEDGAGPMGVLFETLKGGVIGFINGFLDIPRTLASLFGMGEQFESLVSWFSNLFGTDEAKAKEGTTEMNTPDQTVTAPSAPDNTNVTPATKPETTAQATSTVGAGAAGATADVNNSSLTTPGAFKPKGSESDAQLIAEVKKLNKLNQAQLDTLRTLSTKSTSVGVVNVYNNAKHNA